VRFLFFLFYSFHYHLLALSTIRLNQFYLLFIKFAYNRNMKNVFCLSLVLLVLTGCFRDTTSTQMSDWAYDEGAYSTQEHIYGQKTLTDTIIRVRPLSENQQTGSCQYKCRTVCQAPKETANNAFCCKVCNMMGRHCARCSTNCCALKGRIVGCIHKTTVRKGNENYTSTCCTCVPCGRHTHYTQRCNAKDLNTKPINPCCFCVHCCQQKAEGKVKNVHCVPDKNASETCEASPLARK
jgi:hypothetical protein